MHWRASSKLSDFFRGPDIKPRLHILLSTPPAVSWDQDKMRLFHLLGSFSPLHPDLWLVRQSTSRDLIGRLSSQLLDALMHSNPCNDLVHSSLYTSVYSQPYSGDYPKCLIGQTISIPTSDWLISTTATIRYFKLQTWAPLKAFQQVSKFWHPQKPL